MSQDERRTDITISTAATALLDEIIKLLVPHGINASRNALSRAIILTILERYEKLPAEKRKAASIAWETLFKKSQYGINFKPDVNRELDSLVNSNLGHDLFITGRPDILLEGLRRVLLNSKGFEDLFDISLDDIKSHLGH